MGCIVWGGGVLSQALSLSGLGQRADRQAGITAEAKRNSLNLSLQPAVPKSGLMALWDQINSELSRIAVGGRRRHPELIPCGYSG